MNEKRPPKRKRQKPITGEIFYPTTDEGKKLLIESSIPVVIDILEKQLGYERLRLLMELYKKRLKQV